jgi:hypothetical protein
LSSRRARQGSLQRKQEAQDQRRLLDLERPNSIWKEGELTATFRQPFNLIAEATAAALGEDGGGGLNSPGHPAWLGFLDTYRTLCIAPPAEILALFEELRLNS